MFASVPVITGARVNWLYCCFHYLIIIIIIFFCPWYSVPKGGEIKQIV